jgi:hypothetical protein
MLPSKMKNLLHVNSILIDLLLLPFDMVYLTKVDKPSILFLLLLPIILLLTISRMEVTTKNLYYSNVEMPYPELLSLLVLTNSQILLSKQALP